MRVLDRLARYRAFEQSRLREGEDPNGRSFSRRSEEVYYVVFPGNQGLDIGDEDRRAVTITRNRDTAMTDVKKYGKHGEVIVIDKEGLFEVINKW